MKKSLFAKLYYPFVLGLKIDLSLAVITGFVTFITSELNNSRAPSLVRLAAAVEPVVNIGWKVTIIISIILTSLVVYEIFLHAKQDRVSYLFHAVYATVMFHGFMYRPDDQSDLVINDAHSNTASRKSAIRLFNKAVRKSVIDFNNSTMAVYIKLPHSQQAQKILKEMQNDIKEEISNRNPQYYVSPPIRSKNQWRYDGTKK